jgi:hypothetical protein
MCLRARSQSRGWQMLVVERRQTLHGSEYHALPLSLQIFCDASDVLNLMKKHVAADGSVENLHVECAQAKIQVLHASELRIVAGLAAAYHNSVVTENFKYERDLYGRSYTLEEDASQAPTDKTDTSSVAENKARSKTGRNNKRTETHDWDEELKGDRFVFDVSYEQNEDLLPWQDIRHEEKYGWYM